MLFSVDVLNCMSLRYAILGKHYLILQLYHLFFLSIFLYPWEDVHRMKPSLSHEFPDKLHFPNLLTQVTFSTFPKLPFLWQV